MKNSYFFTCFIALILITSTGFSQRSDFRVAINTNVFGSGDTLKLQAEYTVGERKLPPATLDVIIKNERGNTWNVRWPLIDGKANGNIVISKFIPKGKYDLWFAVQPRVFRIYGQLVYCSRKKVKTLETLMGAGLSMYKPQQIKLEADRSFIINNWMLTNEINLGFTTGDFDDVLHIHPECWLDSAYNPAAQSYVSMLVTDADTAVTAKSVAPALRPLAWSGAGVYNNLAPAEVYNHFFSKGMFRDTSEILIDVMGDTTVTDTTNSYKYISGKLLEHKITVIEKNEKLFYEGKELVLFLNEYLLPTKVSMLHNERFLPTKLSLISLKNLAIVKLLRHYVTTEDGTQLNALVLYTKRYPFVDPGIAQNQFYIKGYNEETILLR